MDIRSKILNIDDRRYEIVHVPEWDLDVRVYAMTARDKTFFERYIYKNQDLHEDFHARLVYMCVCDENGIRIFSETDIPQLQDKSASAIVRLADVASKISRINGDVEALAEKNSENVQTGSGSTD